MESRSLRLEVCLRLGAWGLGLFLAFTSCSKDLRLISLDPCNSDASLLQHQTLPGVSNLVRVYAPLGPDLTAHVNRIAQFNLRPQNPTRWKLDLRTSTNFFQRLLRQKAGDIVVVSGKANGRMAQIEALVRRRFHVFAGPPWVIDPGALPKLAATLKSAGRKRLVLMEPTPERFEITFLLLCALVNDPEIFGVPIAGSIDAPAVQLKSVRRLDGEVGERAELRAAWFFDTRRQAEGLSDAGAHLAGLAPWILFPDQAIHCTNDIRVLSAARRPILISRDQFFKLTAAREFPEFLHDDVAGDALRWFGNHSVHYTLRGIHVKLDVVWAFQNATEPAGGNSAVFRGSRSRIEIRPVGGADQRGEVFVLPNHAAEKSAVLAATSRRIEALGAEYPGLEVHDERAAIRIAIPEHHRLSREERFALAAKRFLEFVRDPKRVPAWEASNLLAKYYVATMGSQLARQSQPADSER